VQRQIDTQTASCQMRRPVIANAGERIRVGVVPALATAGIARHAVPRRCPPFQQVPAPQQLRIVRGACAGRPHHRHDQVIAVPGYRPRVGGVLPRVEPHHGLRPRAHSGGVGRPHGSGRLLWRQRTSSMAARCVATATGGGGHVDGVVGEGGRAFRRRRGRMARTVMGRG
jgi:hypothetical protein